MFLTALEPLEMFWSKLCPFAGVSIYSIFPGVINAGWWFQPLWKNMNVNWDDDIPNIYIYRKDVFQTTNQNVDINLAYSNNT